jgi:hypothetical protein
MFAAVVGLLSAFGVIVASYIASRATRTNADAALIGVSRQINFQTAEKFAELRQEWINGLRKSMASLQSYGVAPSVDQTQEREFFMVGTQIELFMNRSDPNYKRLQDCMYAFFSAKMLTEKFACNRPYIDVCQDILKTEWNVLKRELREANRARQISN